MDTSTSNQTKFMYLFERISEPIYFSPRGQGEKQFLYVTPLNHLPPNIAKVVIEMRKGIPTDKVESINVSYSSIPYDLTSVKLLPKEAIFSTFNKMHQQCAASLIKIFSEQTTLIDFLSAASISRDEVNSHLWVYSMIRAIILRSDLNEFKLPGIWEIMPDRFLNGSVLSEAKRQARLPQNERSVVVVDRSFSGLDLDPEHKLVYFREDIALNAAHWTWHIVYPLDAPRGQRDRKGELFFKMHHDLIARYDAERLSNGLGRVTPLNIQTFATEASFPKITLENSSSNYGTRAPNTPFQSVNRLMDPNSRTQIDLDDLALWAARINEAIDSGIVISSTGETSSIANEKGIDTLGDILEASDLTPNSKFYGNYHNEGHILSSFCQDPDFRYKENPGVMYSTETAIRDAIFFRWHKHIDNIFLRLKNTLTAYTTDNLVWSDVVVTHFNLQTEDRTPNTLVTYFEQRDIDLSRGLDFGRNSSNNLGPILARFTHLQHEDFLYKFQVRNTSEKSLSGTVRIFMAPRLDEQQVRLTLTQQQILFFEMDKYTVRIRPGLNVYERRSKDSTITIPWEQSFRDLERNATSCGRGPKHPSLTMPWEHSFHDFIRNPHHLDATKVVCACGWPSHLLIPKGKPEGFACDVFMIITNWEDDRVRRTNSDADLRPCNPSIGFCGILNELFPDKKPMGYPFDRKPRKDSAFTYLEDWMIPNSNMKTVEVSIIHRNATFVFESAVQNVPLINQNESGVVTKNDFGKQASDVISRTVRSTGIGPSSSSSKKYENYNPGKNENSDWVVSGNK